MAIDPFYGGYSALHCRVKAARGDMGMAVFFTKIGAGLDLLMGNLGTPGLGKILNLFIYT